MSHGKNEKKTTNKNKISEKKNNKYLQIEICKFKKLRLQKSL